MSGTAPATFSWEEAQFPTARVSGSEAFSWEEAQFPTAQGLPSAVANAAAQGVVGMVGQGVSSAGRTADIGRKNIARRAISAAAQLAENGEEDPRAVYQSLPSQVERRWLTDYLSARPEQRQTMLKEHQDALDAEDNAALRGGNAIQQWAKDYFSVAPEQEGILTGSARMLGSAGAAIGAAGAAGLVAGPPGAWAALTGAAMTAFEPTYQEAKRRGASDEDAKTAAVYNTAIQAASMGVPAARFLSALPAPLRETGARTLGKIAEGSANFAIGAGAGKAGENLVMREVVDPDQSLTEGVGEAALQGAIAGAALPGGVAAGRLVPRAVEGVRDALRPNAPEALLDDFGQMREGVARLPADMDTILVKPEDGVFPPEGVQQDILPDAVVADQAAPAPPEPAILPGVEETAPVPRDEVGPRPRRPESAVDVLIREGGVRDNEGDLHAIGADQVHHRQAGRLVTKRGRTPDMARERLAELGYLRPNSTIADFYDLIAEHISGRPTYPPEYIADALEWDANRRAVNERDRAADVLDNLKADAERVGIRLSSAEEDHALSLLGDGATMEEAIYEAVRAADEARLEAYNEARKTLSRSEADAAQRLGENAPSPQAARAREELAVVMQRIMRRVGLPSSVGLKLVNKLIVEGRRATSADGAYLNKLITFALDTPPGSADVKFFHEIIHALMDPSLGVLTPRQRAALLRAGDRWLAEPANRLLLDRAGYPPEHKIGEAVSRLAERVLTQAGMETPLVTRAVDAMQRAVEAIGSGLRGQGFHSADGVFRAIMQGKTGGARSSEGMESAPLFSVRDRQDGAYARRPVAQGKLPTDRETWEEPALSHLDTVVRALQDNRRDLAQVQRQIIRKRGASLPDALDAYRADERAPGIIGTRVKELHERRVTPILEEIAAAGRRDGVTLDDVEAYLKARHAPEYNAEMKRRNPELPNNDALSGQSDAEAAATIEALRLAGKADSLATIAGLVDGLVKDTRRVLVREGIIPAEQAAAWESLYQNYVPFKRRIDENYNPTYFPEEQGSNRRISSGAQHSIGSEREVVDVLANVIGAAEQAIVNAEKNRVRQTMAELVKAYPKDDFWTLDTPPTENRFNPDTGLVEYGVPDPLWQMRDNVLLYKENGETKGIVFNERNGRAVAIARGLRDLDVPELSLAMQLLRAATGFYGSLFTSRSPDFWITNFQRDIQSAGINMAGEEGTQGLQWKAVANIPRAMAGLRDLYRGDGTSEWAGYAREMARAGGVTGMMDTYRDTTQRMTSIKKEVDRLNQGRADIRRVGREALRLIDDYNNIVENSIRLAVFQAARDAGASTPRSANIAKNVTINFNRHGNMTRSLNAGFMFFNASVQGAARTLGKIKNSKTARAILGGYVAAGFLSALMNQEIMGGEWEKIPEWIKSHNLIVPTSWDGKDFVKIPLAVGPNAILNLGRLAADTSMGRQERSFGEVAGSVLGSVFESFTPLGNSGIADMFIPSVAKPLIQLGSNTSWTGAPIYKKGEQPGRPTDTRPAFRRHFENTPELWKEISEFLNTASGGSRTERGAVDISPDALRFAVTAMTGGPGRTIDQAIDAVTTDSGGPHRWPFLSRVIGRVDERMTTQAYFRERRRLMDAMGMVSQGTKDGNPKVVSDGYKALGNGSVDEGRKVYNQIKQAEKTRAAVTRQTNRLERGDLSAEEKAQRKKLQSVSQDAIERFLRERYEDN